MATVVLCDRCKCQDRQTVTVLGKDLCNDCIRDFASWVAMGPSPEKRQRGSWLAAVQSLLRVHEVITVDMLVEATNRPYRNAHDALRYLKSQGVLDQVKQGEWIAPAQAARSA